MIQVKRYLNPTTKARRNSLFWVGAKIHSQLLEEYEGQDGVRAKPNKGGHIPFKKRHGALCCSESNKI